MFMVRQGFHVLAGRHVGQFAYCNHDLLCVLLVQFSHLLGCFWGPFDRVHVKQYKTKYKSYQEILAIKLIFMRCAMRTVPMMRVEVAGVIVTRPGQLDVLQYDSTGKPTVSRMRPQLLAGEVLVERTGRIPAIARDEA
jgi:hypothetical protein